MGHILQLWKFRAKACARRFGRCFRDNADKPRDMQFESVRKPPGSRWRGAWGCETADNRQGQQRWKREASIGADQKLGQRLARSVHWLIAALLPHTCGSARVQGPDHSQHQVSLQPQPHPSITRPALQTRLGPLPEPRMHAMIAPSQSGRLGSAIAVRQTPREGVRGRGQKATSVQERLLCSQRETRLAGDGGRQAKRAASWNLGMVDRGSSKSQVGRDGATMLACPSAYEVVGRNGSGSANAHVSPGLSDTG